MYAGLTGFGFSVDFGDEIINDEEKKEMQKKLHKYAMRDWEQYQNDGYPVSYEEVYNGLSYRVQQEMIKLYKDPSRVDGYNVGSGW